MATITPGDYAHNRTYVIDHNKIDATLNDYPVRVLLNITANIRFDFSEPLSSNGGDIIFTSNDGVYTVLDFEEVYFDDTNELAEYYVKIPTVSADEDTTFLMFWGRSGQTSQENPTAVWDSRYAAVYHLGASVDDSTSNSNDGIATGTTVINKESGKTRQFNGTSDYITVSADGTLNTSNYRVMVYARLTVALGSQASSYPMLANKRSSVAGWAFYYNKSSDELQQSFGTGTELKYGNFSIDFEETDYNVLQISHDGTDGKLYVNGTLKETLTFNYAAGSEGIVIGATATPDNYIAMEVREIRLLNTATINAAEEAADYLNLAGDLAEVQEFGRKIKIIFTEDLRYSSIENCLPGFDIYATEKRYVPGGDDQVVHYTAEDVEIDGVIAEKLDFDNGNETDILASPDGSLTLEPTQGSPQYEVPYASTIAYAAIIYKGTLIEISEPVFFISATLKVSYYGGTHTVKLYNLPGTTLDYAQGTELYSYTTPTLSSSVQEVNIPIGVFLLPGRYTLRCTAGNKTYYARTNLAFPYTNGPVSVTKGIEGASPNQYVTDYRWYGPYAFNFAPATFSTTGTWTYPIDIDDIKDLGVSVIRWEEDVPADTTLRIYTAVNDSNITEPTVWEEQVYNGYDSPALTPGNDYTGKYLWIKLELTTTDNTKTPKATEPYFKIVEYTNQDTLFILISEGSGFNKATGDISVDYVKADGGLSSDAAGHPRVEDFNETFTPTDLLPIDDPGILEAMDLDLTDYVIDRIAITFIEGFAGEAIGLGLTDLTITRTNVDDLPP